MAVHRKYVQMFLEEAGEILSRLNQRLLALEESGADPETLQSALRLTHTLKGGAKMVGLDNVSRAAHALESSFKSLGPGAVPPSETSRFLHTLDRIRAALDLVAQGREGAALALELLEGPAEGPRESGSNPGERLEAKRRLGSDRVRVSVEKLDSLQNLADDLVLQKTRILDQANRFRKAFRGLERFGWDDDHGIDDLTTLQRSALRRLIRLLGGRGVGTYLEDLHDLDQVVSEIQDHVFELRMVPLAEVLDEYNRTVRDLARDLGKEVSLTIDGMFTEIDKRLLEAIQAPLMHLVRNALDHGIERPEQRVALGKPRRGQVIIRAYHKGSAVVLEVEDDGRGLDPKQIRRGAVEKGLIAPEEAAALPDGEILYLLCEPGFSTRETVSEVSGRGVGLDVVKARVEKLKGSLVIQGEKGRFTRFRMYLPLSISSLSALIVRAGEGIYALPSLFVDRCLKVDPAELAAREGTWVHEGQALPVVSLARTLGVHGGAPQGRTSLVAVQFRSRRMILQVDALEEERQIILKPLGEHLKEVPYVLGASFLADGRPVPVLNVVDLHGRWPALEAACRFQAGAPVRPPRILVVDDSVTTRHMEQYVLEGLGFQVLQAADGLEAWQVLGRRGVDLVLTDIEMPGMGGLELCRRIRSAPETADLPVVAVSNRSGQEDLEAGFLAGVDAYLRKDQFSQRQLASTLRGLLAGERGERPVAFP